MNYARLHKTALHHAAKVKSVDMIDMLVEFGANIYAKDKNDKKPIDYIEPGSPAALCLEFYESKSQCERGFYTTVTSCKQ